MNLLDPSNMRRVLAKVRSSCPGDVYDELEELVLALEHSRKTESVRAQQIESDYQRSQTRIAEVKKECEQQRRTIGDYGLWMRNAEAELKKLRSES